MPSPVLAERREVGQRPEQGRQPDPPRDRRASRVARMRSEGGSPADQWEDRLVTAGRTHYLFSQRLQTQTRLAEAFIISVTVTGAAIAFSTPWSEARNAVVVGILSSTAAVATLLTAVWSPAQRSTQHREVAAAYFGLRRQVEVLKTIGIAGDLEALTRIRERYDDLSRGADLPPQRLYRRVRNERRASAKPNSLDSLGRGSRPDPGTSSSDDSKLL